MPEFGGERKQDRNIERNYALEKLKRLLSVRPQIFGR